jgi:hypothetical protein
MAHNQYNQEKDHCVTNRLFDYLPQTPLTECDKVVTTGLVPVISGLEAGPSEQLVNSATSRSTPECNAIKWLQTTARKLFVKKWELLVGHSIMTAMFCLIKEDFWIQAMIKDYSIPSFATKSKPRPNTQTLTFPGETHQEGFPTHLSLALKVSECRDNAAKIGRRPELYTFNDCLHYLTLITCREFLRLK